jgi:hypothetical protein
MTNGALNKGWRVVPVGKGFWEDNTETCLECGHRFNLLNVKDNEEWFFGHNHKDKVGA